MTARSTPKRREKVEPGIYRRPDGRLEIGWRDASGTQRWHVVDGGIKAARNALATEHAKRAKGERIASPRLTLARALDAAWEQKRGRLARSSQTVYEASRKRVRGTSAAGGSTASPSATSPHTWPHTAP